jgi:hypothetical protein
MLKGNSVASVHHRAIRERLARKPVVREHAEELGVEQVPLRLVSRPRENRHAKQVVFPVSV